MSVPDAASSRGRGAALLAGAVVFTLVSANLVFRVLLSGEQMPTMGDDMLFYYYPSYLALSQQIAAGEFPIWNPYQLCGVPTLASIQVGNFYPAHLIFVFMSVSSALVAISLLHYGWAAIGGLVLARKLGLGWPASVLFASFFGAYGFFPGVINFPNIVEVIAWLPWGCVAVLGLARGSRIWGSIAGIGLCSGMSLLAGYPQDTVYSLYFWGGMLLLFLGLERRPPRAWAIALMGLFAGVAVGGLLAGAALFPTYEVSAGGSKDLDALSWQEMFPVGGDADLRPILSLTNFIGAAGVALLPASLLLKRHRGLALGFAGMGALALSFAAGPRNPLFELYLWLPMLESFRLPVRIKFVADFCFAMVAAIGLDATWRLSRESLGNRTHWPLLLSSGAAVAVALYYASLNSPRFGYPLAIALVLAVAAALTHFGREPGRALPRAMQGSLRWVVAAVLLVIAIEVVTSPPMAFRVLYMTPSDREVFHRPTRIKDFLARQSERVFIHSLGLNPVFPKKVASVYGFRSVSDYEPATIRRHAEYFRYLMMGPKGLEPHVIPYAGELVLAGPRSDPAALDERSRLLDLTAARYLLADYDLARNEHLQAYLERTGHREVMKDHEGTLFENPRALPRAFVTYRVESAPPTPELLSVISRSDFDPRVFSFVEGAPGFEASPNAPRRGSAARIVHDGIARVEVRARLRAPGMLVLSDTYFRGWQAWVDGEEVEIRAVNHLFRGVSLPAGEHHVRFIYRPESFRRGLLASAGGGLALLGLLLWEWRAARQAAGSRGESADGQRFEVQDGA